MKNTNVTKAISKKLTSADKTPSGKVGGISKAPKTALPKAQMGGSTGAQMKAKGQAMKAKGQAMKAKGQSQTIRGKIQGGLDYILGSDNLRAKGAALNKKLQTAAAPYAKSAYNALNKALSPISGNKTAKMQNGGMTGPTRPIPGRSSTTGGPYNTKGLLPKGTVVDSKYNRDKKKNLINRKTNSLPTNKFVKKMQYGGDNMSLGPVSNFKPKPSTSSTPTPTPTPTPAPVSAPTPAPAPKPMSVKEAREQARIAKINAKTAAYNSGAKVPGQTANKILDAGVEGARIFNNVMQARQGNNNGGMKKGGSTKKYQNGGSTGAQLKAKGQAMKAKGMAMKAKGASQTVRGKIQGGLDYMLGSDNLRAKGAALNKSLQKSAEPYKKAAYAALEGPANKLRAALTSKPKLAKNKVGGTVKRK